MEKNLKIKEVSGTYHGFIEENLGTEKKCILTNNNVQSLVKEALEDNAAFNFNISFINKGKIYASEASYITKI